MSEMTVEQAIISINNLKYFVERTLFDGKTISVSLSMAIKALEENEKLKSGLESETDLVNSQYDEIEKLKEELAQSKQFQLALTATIASAKDDYINLNKRYMDLQEENSELKKEKEHKIEKIEYDYNTDLFSVLYKINQLVDAVNELYFKDKLH